MVEAIVGKNQVWRTDLDEMKCFNINCLHILTDWSLFISTIHNRGASFHSSLFIHLQRLCICDGDFDLDTRLDADGGDLLDDLRRTVQINQTLVDPHLKAIPGLGSFTTGGFSGGDAQSLQKSKTSELSQEQKKLQTWFNPCRCFRSSSRSSSEPLTGLLGSYTANRVKVYCNDKDE